MAQFTVSGLARLLANVEREILVQALEKADLVHLLPSRHLGILEDVEGNWNTLFNIWLGGALEDAARAQAAYERALKTGIRPASPIWAPTGILSVDGALASARLATDFFNPDGIMASLIARVDELMAAVSGIPTVHPDPEPAPRGEPTNIYDLDQLFGHTLNVVDDLQTILQTAEFGVNNIHINQIQDFRAIISIIGDLEKGTRHDAQNIILHRERFINDMLGETFVEDVYH